MTRMDRNQAEMYFRRRCQILFRKLFAPAENGEIPWLLPGANEQIKRDWEDGIVKYLAFELNVPKKCFSLEAQRYEHAYITIDHYGKTQEHSSWPAIWPYAWHKYGVFCGREKISYPTALDEIHFFNGLSWHTFFDFLSSWKQGICPEHVACWPYRDFIMVDIFRTMAARGQKAA